ncbi:MAG: LamG-like jellyroll fold domain-containing protein [Bdellovibrionota bacterium]
MRGSRLFSILSIFLFLASFTLLNSCLYYGDLGDISASSLNIETIHPSWIKTDGLVSYWKMDGFDVGTNLASDSVGSNTLQFFGVVSAGNFVPGKINSGLAVSNTAEYLANPVSIQSIGLPSFGSDQTLSIWFRNNGGAYTGNNLFLLTYPNSSTLSFAFSSLRSLKATATPSVILISGATVASVDDGSWHHAAYTFSSSANKYSLYYDGALLLEAAPGTVPSTSGSPVSVKLGGANAGYSSELDEATIWNRELSAGEILGIYQHQF